MLAFMCACALCVCVFCVYVSACVWCMFVWCMFVWCMYVCCVYVCLCVCACGVCARVCVHAYVCMRAYVFACVIVVVSSRCSHLTVSSVLNFVSFRFMLFISFCVYFFIIIIL